MGPDNNLLTILSALGQGADTGIVPTTYQPVSTAPASNVLQAIQAPPPVAQPAPVQAPTPVQAPAAEPPRKRRSVIDTIGRLADVFAKVGGAEALYQPTLDSRDDRTRQIDLDQLKIALTRQQVAGGQQEVEATERKRLGTALGALAGRENAAALWPSIAEQAGIDPTKAAGIGQILTANPDAAGIFARSLGADIDNLGKNVYFGTDPSGKTVAYQVGEDGRPHILDFNGELAPSDPTKVINLGGTTAVIGSGGQIKRVLPNTERPGGAEDRASRERIAAMKPGAGGAGKSGGNPAMVQSAISSLNDLQSSFDQLKKLGAVVSPTQSTAENIRARFGASGLGQMVEGAVGTQAQSIRDNIESNRNTIKLQLVNALNISSRSIDSNKEAEAFMKTVTDPRSSYESNMKAIQRMRQLLAAAPKTVTPVKSVLGGWGKATVVQK